jgi:hypothetical protein
MSGSYGASHWLYKAIPFETGQSLKFNDDDSPNLKRTPTSAGNRRTFTFSCWVKRGKITSDQAFITAGADAQNRFQIYFLSNDKLGVYGNTSNSDKIYAYTDAVFRDVSAWYNICAVIDSTDGSASNRLKMYVNGIEQSYTYGTTPSQNEDFHLNNTVAQAIGSDAYAASNLFDGYMADVYLIDGQALDPTSFTETVDYQLKPKEYFGTYGTNGFRLNFQDDVIAEGFNALGFKGTSGSQSLFGLGFSPALVWNKRVNNTDDPVMYDILRGVGRRIYTSGAYAEAAGGLASFDSDGFSWGSTVYGTDNNSNSTYIAWCWEAGGTPTADNSAGAGATPTAGSVKIDGVNKSDALAGTIPATRLTANTAKGFSIVTFEGTSTAGSVAHGLSIAPKWVIAKNRDSATEWPVYHGSVNSGGGSYLRLDTNAANTSSSIIWTASPTDTVVNIGTYEYVNRDSMVLYCWNEVEGYSKFDSFTGNGGSQEITVGFKPALVALKRSSNTSNWHVFDATRNGDNPRSSAVQWDLNNAEVTNANMQFTDTGFNDNGYVSDSGETILYMAFADTRQAAFFKDASGNNNNFTANNLDYRDSMIDTPLTNFCTLNPLFTNLGTATTLAEGNLKFTADSDYALANGTFAMRAGKWYWETLIQAQNVSNVGITRGQSTSASPYVGYHIFGFGYQSTIIYGAAGDGTAAGATLATSQTSYTTGDIIGCSFDADAGELKFYKNNSLVYTISSINEHDWMPATSGYGTSNVNVVNFGQDSSFSGNKIPQGNGADGEDFFYTPPTGFKSLQISNLPTPVIADPTTQFKAVTYTGNGSTTKSIDIETMNPDFVWIKSRSSGSGHHSLIDSVRGDIALNSNQTIAEYGVGAFNFNSDNTIDVPYYANDYSMNTASSTTYVAWNWLAGGATPSQTYTVKVVSDSGNKYRFDDFGTSAITLDLQEGGTYTFDQSDSSNSGHPFRFSTTANGTHGGGSEYTVGVTTNGTAGSAGAYTRITVAASAPTLYYYCTQHSGMGGQANTNSTFGSTNVKGTIQAVVSANSTAGFSIIKYTGNGSNSTIGHGLSSPVEALIIKERNATSQWVVGHHKLDASAPFDKGLYLDDARAVYDDATNFNDTAPTSAVFSVGTGGYVNDSGNTYICYAFHSVKGYCKVGSYVGNGSTNGPFIHTGFRPAWVLFKNASNAESWQLIDSTRSPYNVANAVLYTNGAVAESNPLTAANTDFLSNGFKIRAASGNTNDSGLTYIYLAFAESPFKTTSAR